MPKYAFKLKYFTEKLLNTILIRKFSEYNFVIDPPF